MRFYCSSIFLWVNWIIMDGVQELIRLDAVLGRWIHCGQLILRKISKLVATRCQILSLKCTKFDFHCSSVSIPEPMGGGLTELHGPPSIL